MYGIQKYLIGLVSKGYQDQVGTEDFELDCSMGCNPYGSPDIHFSRADMSRFYQYPDNLEEHLAKLIVKDFAGVCALDPNMVIFSNGSMGALTALSRACLAEGKTVICTAPTFSAALDNIRLYKPRLVEVPLRRENNFRLDQEEFLAAVENYPNSYIYLDNPNNPTGQVYPLEFIEELARRAQVQNSLVVVDEAYGDYLELNHSSAQMICAFDNLVCVRSFSKGFGLAGLRLGYLIAKPDFVEIFHRTNVPFAVSTPAGIAAEQVLKSDWRLTTQHRTRCDKPLIAAQLKTIQCAQTSPYTPICLLYVKERLDLAEYLGEFGLRVINCKDFNGLDERFCRLNLHQNIERLCSLLSEADAELKRRLGLQDM